MVSTTDDRQALAYNIRHGMGIRRDGIGSPGDAKSWSGPKYHGIDGFCDAWTRAPIVFEWFGPHHFLIRRGWSFDDAVEFMLTNHVTFIHDNLGEVPDEQIHSYKLLQGRFE